MDVVKTNDLKSSPEFHHKKRKKRGGWRAIIFILATETLEKLATVGLLWNFTVYLMKVFHLEQADAANVNNIWMGISNLTPLIGAYISDAYAGRTRTIACSSFLSISGLLIMTFTASFPQLHPPPCNNQQFGGGSCVGPNKLQMGVLVIALGFLAAGTGGIRPCCIPFGVDQFDQRTEEGQKSVGIFFNWYYTSVTLCMIITMTVLVYIQDEISWVIGFGLQTGLMCGAVILFFLGMRFYVTVKPEGSLFSDITQVVSAAYKKRKLTIPVDDKAVQYYDPPLKATVLHKLQTSDQFRCLNKAAMVAEGDLMTAEGVPADKKRLCSVQQVEEMKCVLRMIPVWSAGILTLLTIHQQATFTVSQAMRMDRHMGPHFQIPPASIGVISLITITIWLPFYDRLIIPYLRKITGHKTGITHLQRIGIGIAFSIVAMIVAGFIERMRRNSANAGSPPMSVFWLAPQLIIMGFSEAFNVLGQIELMNSEFPEHMRSIANALLSLSSAISSSLSSIMITAVHKYSGGPNKPDWLNKDINAGKLDYFYYVIAGVCAADLVYFWFCARSYQYKASFQTGDVHDKDGDVDVEMSSAKQLTS